MGLISHLTAALVFGLLTLLLSVSWRGRSQGMRFITASGLTVIWAVVLAFGAYSGRVPFGAIYVVELLRDGAWLAVLLGIGGSALSRGLRITVVVVWLVALVGGLLAPGLPGIAGNHSIILAHSGLALALCGLILIEQTYRNASPVGRRNLRYLVYGLGGVFVYDLFLYSQAELMRGIGSDAWSARGFVNALMVPLVAVAVRRNPEWSLEVFVSRHVVFYTGSIVATGIYLLAMSAGGYYVRQIGGEWGGVAQIVFFAGAVAVLLSLLFSETLRGQFKVFLSKHFYRNKYDYRVEWLRFIQTLSSTDEGGVEPTAVRAVAQILASPGGVLYMTEDVGRPYLFTAIWPADLTGLPPTAPMSADHDLIYFLAERQWIIDLDEYRQSPSIYRNIELPAWMIHDTRWRFVTPLLELDRLLGFILLQNPVASFQLTFEDRDLLKMVGRHVATHIAQHRSDRKLAEGRQFEAYNRLVAFMMHDLKNSVAQLKLVVANAERHKRNPEFVDDAISTIANAVERITRLTGQLQNRTVADERREVDMNSLVHTAFSRLTGRKPEPRFDSEINPAWVQADPEKLSSVIEHLIRNAQDATKEDGQVSVRLFTRGKNIMLSVMDTGSGMDPEFVRERLFRPFDSTKGSKGMGIGAYQAREYVRLLEGDVEVQSTPGSGTVFSIRLPRLQKQ